jgi:hypothetical protein
MHALPGAENVLNRFHSTKGWIIDPDRPAINVLFDVLSAREGRGDQAEGDGLANTTVLFLQDNPRLRQDTRLSACIHFRSLFVLRSLLTRLMNGSLEFILSSDRGPCGLPLNTRMPGLLI